MVYFVAQNNQVKIGFSDNIKQRMKNLSTSSPFPLILLGYHEGSKEDEKKIQRMFGQYHLQLEWYQLNSEIINFVNENTITDTYCDFDNDVVRVYKKMKN